MSIQDSLRAKLGALEEQLTQVNRSWMQASNHFDTQGNHIYYGTSCLHDDHEACKVICKTCSSPCVCVCHIPGYQGT